MKFKTSLIATVLSLASTATVFAMKADIVNAQVQDGIRDVSVPLNPSLFNQSKQPYLIARTNWARLAGRRTRRINLRTKATINSPTKGYGLGGDRVQILQCRRDYDRRGSDLNWCRVSFPRSGAIGWIRSDSIIFNDGGE